MVFGQEDVKGANTGIVKIGIICSTSSHYRNFITLGIILYPVQVLNGGIR